MKCGVRDGDLSNRTSLAREAHVMKRVSLALLALAAAAPLRAQSLLYRPPNLGGTWVPDGGVVQFNFVHRFYVSPGPSHSVVNFPNFTIAAGFGRQVAFGAQFATKSIAGLGNAAQSSNETAVYGRWRAHGAEGQPGFAIAVTPAYNFLAKSVDGEVGVAWTHGPLTLHGAARAMSRRLGESGNAAAAFAGGFNARLNPYIGVSADVGSFVSPTVRAAWSAAINFLIPGSPHTFSLQASNAGSGSIQGASEGIAAPKNILYGFEFTIPLHLKRFAPWFHGSPKPVALGAPGAAVAAEVAMTGVKFGGETVTFARAEPGSPPIPPNGSYVHRFDKPGTYTYHCTPHPFMKGVVVVK